MEENQSPHVKDAVSTNKEVSGKGSRLVTEGHPLMNAVVLDNIIRLLKYEDVKSFRLVCQRWEEVSKSMFWKSSTIKVTAKNSMLSKKNLGERALELAEEINVLIDSFEVTFPSPAGLPTNAVQFEGFINRRALEYFWKQRGSSTLTNVYFRSVADADIAKGSIDLNRYITPKLTTLNIDALSIYKQLTISTKMLANIQNLSLYRCDIVADGKIVPRELVLMLCRVSYEGKLFKPNDPLNSNDNGPKMLINNFVDFSKMKKLTLQDNFWKLNLGGDRKELEQLSLRSVQLIGLDNSLWTTNCVQVDAKTTSSSSYVCVGDKMQINSIPGIDIVGRIDLESLPKTLEHLFCSISSSSFSLPRPVICEYPKLTSLTLHIFLMRDLPILDFTNCTSLVDFQLSVPSGVCGMDRIKLPNSIKNVKLRNVIPDDDVPWQLNTLILYRYPFWPVEVALRHFKTAKLVIQLNSKSKREQDLMTIANYWRNSSIEQLAVGYLGVDGVERYFLFTNKNCNGKGEEIDRDRFEKLSSLNLHKNLLPSMKLF